MNEQNNFIIDAHLDLAMNALEWNRDLKKSVYDIREREKGKNDKPDRNNGTVALPELRIGKVGIVVATQIARVVEPGNTLSGWNSPEIAWAITQAQLSWYNIMENEGEMLQITNVNELECHLNLWLNTTIPDSKKPIGYILNLEGADSLVEVSYLEKAYRNGLRVCGPAHYGPGRYASGTGSIGGFTKLGFELLREMDQLHMILDITHLTDKGFIEAVDTYKGFLWASHHNCRSLVNHQRQLTDEQIKILIERGAVIGGVMDAWMLANDWQIGVHDPEVKGVKMENVIDHYDHICQIAGNSKHVAIGSDLDGGYGKEQTPYDLETIADLQNLKNILTTRGYSSDDIENIFHRNWLRFLRNAWT
jgi:membrane dipeptidase